MVNAGGMYAAEIGRLAGVRVPIVPMAHEYLVTAAVPRAARRTCPTLRDPDHLVYFREEGGGLVMGGYERACAPWSVGRRARRHPAGLQRPPARGGLGPLRADRRQRARRVPAMEDVDGHAADQRARRRSRPTASSASARPRCAGCSWPPASAPTAWPARAAWAGRWPSGSPPASRRSTCGAWTSAASARTTARRAYTLARAREVYETYYDIKYPNHERAAGRPLRLLAGYDWHASTARRSARSRAGSG